MPYRHALLVPGLCALMPMSHLAAQEAPATSVRQVTIRLSLPRGAAAGTPPYYLAAEHNRWRADDPAYRFLLVDGRYQVSFRYDKPYYLQYRITRGAAATDESDAAGYGVPPRLAEIVRDTTIDIQVAGFRDAIRKRSTALPGRVVILAPAFPFPAVGRTHRASVYLPATYRRGTKRYPVIYLMDGEAIFDRARTDDGKEWRVDETLDSLARRGGRERIVVAIDAGDFRGSEYLPYPTPSGRPASQGDAFMRDLVTGLIPAVNRRFRTLRDAENTAIGGSSMGAAIALYGLTHFPTTFGAAAIFSLPRWTGFPMARLLADATALNADSRARIYLYVGGREGSDETVTSTRALHRALRTHPLAEVVLDVNDAGEHRAEFWREPFARFAAWLGEPRRKPDTPALSPALAAFRTELVKYGAEDQAIRDTIVQMMQGTRATDTAVIGRQSRGDLIRATWLAGRVAELGWPKRTMVGDTAAEGAFYIVQHAVHDTAFQARMLPWLTQAAAAGEASGESVALLTDRIAVRRGEPQVYGTQAKLKDGRMLLDPIADSANVNTRRARVGLPPLEEYLQRLRQQYLKPTPP